MCTIFPSSTTVMYGNHPGKFLKNFCEVESPRMVTEIYHRNRNEDGIFV